MAPLKTIRIWPHSFASEMQLTPKVRMLSVIRITGKRILYCPDLAAGMGPVANFWRRTGCRSRGLWIYDVPGIAERIDGCLDVALPPLRTAEMLLRELGPHYDSTGLAIAYKSLDEALDLIEQNRLEGATLIS
jgi:hypothetical protein